MRPDELRTAATDFLAYVSVRHRPDLGYSDLPPALEAAATVCERWLAEHPADGGEPVTAEWLEATGGKKQFNGIYTFSLPESDHGSRICVGFYPGFDNAVLQLLPSSRNSLPALAPAPTRGHVRRLLAALGLTLTESTPCPASSATPSPSDPSTGPS